MVIVPSIVLLLVAVQSHAQELNEPDTIQVKKSFLSTSYRYQGKKLGTKDLRELYKTVDDREPTQLLERSKRFSRWSNVVGWSGVPIAVYGLAHDRNSEDKHTVSLIVLGFGMQAIGAGFGIASDNAKLHSVERFNGAVHTRASLHILQPDQLLCVGLSF